MEIRFPWEVVFLQHILANLIITATIILQLRHFFNSAQLLTRRKSQSALLGPPQAAELDWRSLERQRGFQYTHTNTHTVFPAAIKWRLPTLGIICGRDAKSASLPLPQDHRSSCDVYALNRVHKAQSLGWHWKSRNIRALGQQAVFRVLRFLRPVMWC